MSFTVRAGEIVCIAGIDGNGQTELVYGLTGLEQPKGGKIMLKGQDITHAPIRKRSTSGISHIPEDRHKHGLVLDFTLEDNMVLQRYFEPEFVNGAGFLKRKAIRAYALRLIEQYDVRSGLLKAYCNVNEVISCIMLNWISLYLVNTILSQVKEEASPYTLTLASTNPDAFLPSLGLGKLFSNNQYVSIAIPLCILISIAVWVFLEKTRLGYELKATGANKDAARYSGMREKKNLILTMAIAGALAGMGAAFLFLTGFEQWQCTQSTVPAMGFNGIAAAFLGGLHPIGSIFSSYFIQHITNGGAYVDKTMYCAQISDLISSIIIYLCSFGFFFKYVLNKWLDRREERQNKKAQAAAEKGGQAE